MTYKVDIEGFGMPFLVGQGYLLLESRFLLFEYHSIAYGEKMEISPLLSDEVSGVFSLALLVFPDNVPIL